MTRPLDDALPPEGYGDEGDEDQDGADEPQPPERLRPKDHVDRTDAACFPRFSCRRGTRRTSADTGTFGHFRTGTGRPMVGVTAGACDARCSTVNSRGCG